MEKRIYRGETRSVGITGDHVPRRPPYIPRYGPGHRHWALTILRIKGLMFNWDLGSRPLALRPECVPERRPKHDHVCQRAAGIPRSDGMMIDCLKAIGRVYKI